jgi:hypothetical protein
VLCSGAHGCCDASTCLLAPTCPVQSRRFTCPSAVTACLLQGCTVKVVMVSHPSMHGTPLWIGSFATSSFKHLPSLPTVQVHSMQCVLNECAFGPIYNHAVEDFIGGAALPPIDIRNGRYFASKQAPSLAAALLTIVQAGSRRGNTTVHPSKHRFVGYMTPV